LIAPTTSCTLSVTAVLWLEDCVPVAVAFEKINHSEKTVPAIIAILIIVKSIFSIFVIFLLYAFFGERSIITMARQETFYKSFPQKQTKTEQF
jgi:amino acid transporter